MTSRRSFLRVASAGFLTPFFARRGSAIPPGSEGPLFHGPFGLQLYSLRNQIKRGDAQSVRAQIAYAKKVGYTEIEAPELYGLTASQFRRELDSVGLPCPSMMATYEQYESDLAGVIRDAHTLGAAFVVNAWIPHQGPFTLELCRRVAANYNRWGRQLKAAGLEFCHHNHDYEFQPYKGKPLYDTLIEETAREYVNFEMDVFWVVAGGQSPVAYLRRYPSRFRLLHLKDMRKGPPVSDYKVSIPVEWDVPLGTGRVDMRGILREGEHIGIKHYFVEDESREAPQNIVKTLRYLKTVRI